MSVTEIIRTAAWGGAAGPDTDGATGVRAGAEGAADALVDGPPTAAAPEEVEEPAAVPVDAPADAGPVPVPLPVAEDVPDGVLPAALLVGEALPRGVVPDAEAPGAVVVGASLDPVVAWADPVVSAATAATSPA